MYDRNAGQDMLLREKEIVRMISQFSEARLKFIVVGGYAVATYKHRFSVDLDVIVLERDIKKFEMLLRKNDYSLAYLKNLSLFYGEKFKRFEKKITGFPVDVDLLINVLLSRTTNASWSFDYVLKHSEKSTFGSVDFIRPSRELLIAMKLHSGRFSDVRDVVAMIENSDLNAVKKHALRGDKSKLNVVLKKGTDFLNSKNFPDSFKGIFGAASYKEEAIKKSRELFSKMIK